MENEHSSLFKKLINKISPSKVKLFTKYFTMFVLIFSILLTILGSSLFILLNNYTIKDRTRLLKESVASISHTIESTMIMQDMNEHYSVEKEMLCSTLATVSQSIDADVFVCNVEGKIIMCGERAGKFSVYGEDYDCPKHDKIMMSNNIISILYEQGEIVDKANVFGTQCFIVGKAVYSDGELIAMVFAISSVGFPTLTLEFIRIFVISAFFCLLFAFIAIYYLTKKMVTPLERMSNAAKQFAVGDFSYRVKTSGNDELADLGKAFNDMANALDALESSRRSFVSNVSHELKTPMTSIAGFIDGILDGTIPKDKQEYYLGIVSTEVRRLSRLVVSMLNMSKIESGDLEMKPVKYDISEQIIHILLTFEQKIENKHIDIRGLDAFSQTQISADPDMIYQAIYNLFDNAVKFTNEGGYIEVQLIDNGSFIEVNIINSGEGIQKEELSKIFERFYKVDKSRSLDAKGAGLGLYIVKLMIEMHGGKVYATSDNQNMAKFTFTLPKQYNPRYKKELRN